MKDDDLNLDDLSLEDEFGGETREDKSDKAVEEIRASEKAKALDEVTQRKLKRAAHLIDAGDFADAAERLDAIEKDEEDRTGDCEIAEVYYLRMFLDYNVRTADEMVDYLVKTRESIEQNKNYRLFKSCADKEEIQKIEAIKKRAEDQLSDTIRKEEEERRRKEEAERKRKEEEERKRKAREEEERKRKEEEERKRKLAADAKAKEEAERKAAEDSIKKNLKRIPVLLATSDFDGAENLIKTTEEEIIKAYGEIDIGDTYYYKIYIDYKQCSEQALVEHLAQNDIDVVKNSNYILAKTFASGEMEKKVKALVSQVDAYKRAVAKKIEDERRAKEEAEFRAQVQEAQKKQEAAEQVRRRKEATLKKVKKVSLVSIIIVAVVLLIVAIWGQATGKGVWAGILIMVIVYNAAILTSNIYSVLNNDETYYVWFFLCVLGGIAAIVLLCLRHYAIWGWALALTFLISNVPPTIIAIINNEDSEVWGPFLGFAIAGLVFFIIATAVVSSYGWSIY